MGKFATGEKPKFDLITASKTKKYRIITAIVLVLGVLLLISGLLLRSTLTAAVMPNSLAIMKDTLSGLDGKGPVGYQCTISKDESFVLSTGTPTDRALTTPIEFILDSNATNFLEVRERTNSTAIDHAYYQGLFYLHVRENALASNEDLTGNLKIICGEGLMLQIKVTYHKKAE